MLTSLVKAVNGTLPGGATIYTSTLSDVYGTRQDVEIIPDPATPEKGLRIYPTFAEGNHIHITPIVDGTDFILGTDDGNRLTLFGSGDVNIIAREGTQTDGMTPSGLGKDISIQAGAAGFNNSNVALGNLGGTLYLTGGSSNLADAPGGEVVISGGFSNYGWGNVKIASHGTSQDNYWIFDNTGTTTFPSVNNSQIKITGATKTIPGNPYTQRGYYGQEFQIWQASAEDVIGAKVTVRLHNDYYTYTELFEVTMLKEATSNANVSFSVGSRLKSNDAYPDGVIDVRLDGDNQLTLYHTNMQGDATLYTFDAIEFKKTT